MICLEAPEDGDKHSIIRLLDVLLSPAIDPEEKCQILENDFNIKVTQPLEREVSLMCNLSKGIEEQGRTKGRNEAILGTIAILKELGLSIQEILVKLQKQFQMSEEELQSFL